MGLFESIFKKEKQEQATQAYFKTLAAYTPVFTTFEGGVYEAALTRACIHAFATHCSKLKPKVSGSESEPFERMLTYSPNPFQDTSKFLYRLATIYSVRNNAIIAPLYDDSLADVVGYYPLLPQNCRVIDVDGVPYLRYQFAGGRWAAQELGAVGLLTQYQYADDLFGSDNRPLEPYLRTLDTNAQGIIEGVKASATIRFMGMLSGVFKEKTVNEERARFKRDNLGTDNNNGLLLVDEKYKDIKQITSEPYTMNAAQMKEIKQSVFEYFGCSDEILQNNYQNSSVWNAYYEGKIEPFAIQLSLVMSNMTYSEREIACGRSIMWTAERLQYATNAEKLEIVTQLFDRGFICRDTGLEVFNMPPLADGSGKKYYIRKDYAEVQELSKAGAVVAQEAIPTGAQPTEPPTPSAEDKNTEEGKKNAV